MKLIKPSFQIISPSGYTLDDIYKSIEIASRTCYKSEDKITPDSAKGFVDRMIKLGHGAMLEHGTVYLAIPYNVVSSLAQPHFKYRYNKYSKVNNDMCINNDIAYVTTNFRVLVENDWLDDLKYICEPTEYHEKRICVRFVCDRGVSHKKFVA